MFIMNLWTKRATIVKLIGPCAMGHQVQWPLFTLLLISFLSSMRFLFSQKVLNFLVWVKNVRVKKFGQKYL